MPCPTTRRFGSDTGNAPGVAPVIEYHWADARGYWPVGASGFAPGVTVPHPYHRYAGGPAYTGEPFGFVPRNGVFGFGASAGFGAGCVLPAMSGRSFDVAAFSFSYPRVMNDGSAWEEVAVVDAEPAEAKGPGASDPHDAPPVDQGGGQGTGPKQDKEDADDEAGPKKDQDVAP